MFFKDSKGFSLLEIMVAAGLLGVLAVFGTKMMTDQTKAIKTVESRAEYTAILTDIRSILALEASCLATFGDLDATSGTVTRITNREIKEGLPPVDTFRYEANADPNLATSYGNSNVKILGYRLSTSDTDPAVGIPAGPVSPVTGTKSGVTNLIIRIHFGHNRNTGTARLERKIRLNVEVDSANLIKKCTSTGSTGLDTRYLQRRGDDEGRTMYGNIIMADGFGIDFQSDATLKKEVKDIKNIVHKLRKVRPVSYSWLQDDKREFGIMAQELAVIFPELVTPNGPNGTYTVRYGQLTPLLLRGLQEVDKENIELKKSLKELSKEMEAMKLQLCIRDPELEFCKE